MTLSSEESLISEQLVVAYLEQHPDFFSHHLELLEAMHIPHPSGNAVSLIAKQLDVFRTRHQEKEHQLSTLIDIARENDAVLNRMHELTLAMLEAQTVEEVVDNLAEVFKDCFLMDFLTIKILRSHVAESFSGELFIPSDDPGLKYFEEELRTNRSRCDRPTFAQACFLFGDMAPKVRSCAIVPMVFTEMEGLLAIGSEDESRFHSGMGTLFLTQISEVVGTRLIALMKARA